MVDALYSVSPEAPPDSPSYAAPGTPGNAGNARSAWSLLLGQPRKPRMHRVQLSATSVCGEGARELERCCSWESM